MLKPKVVNSSVYMQKLMYVFTSNITKLSIYYKHDYRLM